MLLFAVLIALCLAVPQAAEAKPLCTYDLTYTLKLDREDPKARRKIWDDAHFVSSLQGIVNRKSPRLYVFFVGGEDGSIDRYWLEEMREHGANGWRNTRSRALPDLDALSNSSAATSTASWSTMRESPPPPTSPPQSPAVENLACVRYRPVDGLALPPPDRRPEAPRQRWLLNDDGSSMFTGKGTIPGSQDAVDRKREVRRLHLGEGELPRHRQVQPHQDGLLHRRLLARAPGAGTCLTTRWRITTTSSRTRRSSSTSGRGTTRRRSTIRTSRWEPMCDAYRRSCARHGCRTGGKKMIHVGGFTPWDKKYTDSRRRGGKHGGVPTEWRYAEIISCFNGLHRRRRPRSLARWPMRRSTGTTRSSAKYPQKLPTIADLKAKGLHRCRDGKVAPKSYVTIYVGDYDSAAWLYQSSRICGTTPFARDDSAGLGVQPEPGRPVRAGDGVHPQDRNSRTTAS